MRTGNSFTFLGTGTSSGVPEIACDCEVCRSNNPCDRRLRASLLLTIREIRGKQLEHPLNFCIDAGPDFREQMIRAHVESLDGIFLTHEHYDHVGGLDDIRPLFRKKPFCPLYLEQHLADVLKVRMPYCFRDNPSLFIPHYDLRIIEPYHCFEPFEGVRVQPLRVCHGKLPILGFRVGNLAYLTDVKTLPEETLEAIRNVDYLVIDGLRFYEHSTHLSVEEAVNFAQQVSAKDVFLTHMAHTIGLHEQVDRHLRETYSNVRLAYDGLSISFSL